MDTIFELLTQGTNLPPWAFLGLCAPSLAASSPPRLDSVEAYQR